MKFKLEGLARRKMNKPCANYIQGGASRIRQAKTLSDLTSRTCVAYHYKRRYGKPPPPPHIKIITDFMIDHEHEFLTPAQISKDVMYCIGYVKDVLKTLPVITQLPSWPRAFKLDSKEYFK